MKTNNKILLLAILVMSSSCSPSERLGRLISNHPELTLSDTLTLRDTIPVPFVQANTLIPFIALKDTVLLKSGRLEIALQAARETLYVKGKCGADTIIRTRRVMVEKIRVIKPDRLDALIAKIPWLVTGLITITIIAGFLIYRIRRIKSIGL